MSNFANNYRWGSFRLTRLFFASFTEPQLFFASFTEPQLFFPSFTEPQLFFASFTEPQLFFASFTEPQSFFASFTEPQLFFVSFTEPQLFFASFTEPQLFFTLSGFRFFEIYLNVRLPLACFRLAVVGRRATCPKCSRLYSEYVVCRNSPMFRKNLLLPSSGGTHNRSVLHITAMKYSNPAPPPLHITVNFCSVVLFVELEHFRFQYVSAVLRWISETDHTPPFTGKEWLKCWMYAGFITYKKASRFNAWTKIKGHF